MAVLVSVCLSLYAEFSGLFTAVLFFCSLNIRALYQQVTGDMSRYRGYDWVYCNIL